MNAKKNRIGATAAALVIATGLSLMPGGALTVNASERAFAASQTLSEEQSESRRPATIWESYKTLEGVGTKSVWNYQRKEVKVNSKLLSQKSLTINGIDYIPSRLAANALGLEYTYVSKTRTVTIKGAGLEMTFSDGCYVSYANGRALFSETPSVIMSDGRMYIPVSIFAKATGLSYNSGTSEITLTGKYKPLLHADKFYRSDEVFWLARIIEAESGGESLLGKIAVGNVVMNRVRSSQYPNTIYGVIFDRKYGVQFSPVLDGSIYNIPSYNSTLAAKIVLDGIDVSEGALFFLRPELSTSSWIPNNRPYAFSIGKHDFYK